MQNALVRDFAAVRVELVFGQMDIFPVEIKDHTGSTGVDQFEQEHFG